MALPCTAARLSRCSGEIGPNWPFEQEVQPPVHDGEGGSELVTDGGEEIGLQLIQLLKATVDLA